MIRAIELLAVVGFTGLAFIGIQIIRGGRKSAIIISVLVSLALLFFNAKLEAETGKGIVGTLYCKAFRCVVAPFAVPAPVTPSIAVDPSLEMRSWLAQISNGAWDQTDSKTLLSEATSKFGREALTTLADSGNLRAALLVGRGYSEGLSGFPRNETTAVSYYKISAASGDARAQNNLATLYLTGFGGQPANPAEAFRLFTLASNQGSAAAQANLGTLYYDGVGTSVDHAQAARLFSLASEQGNALAANHLGVMYERGEGGLAQNLSRALELYRAASAKDFALGHANLARFYDYGWAGVTPDRGEAIRLYRLAAAAGNEMAKKRLGDLGV